MANSFERVPRNSIAARRIDLACLSADAERTGPDSEVAGAVVEDSTELELRAQTRKWLVKHGCPLPIGRLTKKQLFEIRECFDVLDADRSGTLDVDELLNAFTMLGFQVSKESVQKIMDTADIDKTGLLEFDEFRSIMARNFTAGEHGAAAPLLPSGAVLPFEDVARTARRRQMLLDVMKGGVARQRIIDASADFHYTTQDPLAAIQKTVSLQHAQSGGLAHAHSGQMGSGNLGPRLARQGASYYLATAARARQAAMELQEAMDAQAAADAAEAASPLAEDGAGSGTAMRQLTPDTESIIAACMEAAGPPEGWSSVLQTHCQALAPMTVHDLARDLLESGIEPGTLLQSLRSHSPTPHPDASDVHMGSKVQWRWPETEQTLPVYDYEMSTTYRRPWPAK